jgi:hypothetical protein
MGNYIYRDPCREAGKQGIGEGGKGEKVTTRASSKVLYIWKGFQCLTNWIASKTKGFLLDTGVGAQFQGLNYIDPCSFPLSLLLGIERVNLHSKGNKELVRSSNAQLRQRAQNSAEKQ